MVDLSLFYIFVQALGVLAMALEVWASRHTNDKQVVLWTAASTGVYTIHFLLLGAFAGAVSDGITTLRCLASQYLKSTYTSVLFIAAYIGLGFFIVKNFIDVLPFAASVFSTIGMFHFSGVKMRVTFLAAVSFWLIYSLYYFSIGGIMLGITLLISYSRTILKMRKAREQEPPLIPL